MFTLIQPPILSKNYFLFRQDHSKSNNGQDESQTKTPFAQAEGVHEIFFAIAVASTRIRLWRILPSQDTMILLRKD
jgi:hypothetical protein